MLGLCMYNKDVMSMTYYQIACWIFSPVGVNIPPSAFQLPLEPWQQLYTHICTLAYALLVCLD